MLEITFSLIMPTRNRSEYLPAGVGYFLNSARDDIELIVSDASDAHYGCLQALAPWVSDPRLVVIDNSMKTTGRLSSMAQNWSRALDAARGRWVCIVGDDDVCDHMVVEFIERLEKVAPGCEAVTWHHAIFDIGIATPREVKIPIGNNVLLAAGRENLEKQASWPNEKKHPSSVCSPYHGAVHRNVLQRIHSDRGGEWFRFATPDYDLGWTTALMAERFALCERPFSIMGVCPKSNSYAMRSEGTRQENVDNWLREAKKMDGWGADDTDVFGLPVLGVLGFRNAFCAAYGINVSLNIDNLVGTLKMSVQNQEDEATFELLRERLLKFLMAKFQQDYGVAEMQRLIRPEEPMAGIVGDLLVAPNALFGGNISRFAEIAFGMVRPVRYLFDKAG